VLLDAGKDAPMDGSRFDALTKSLTEPGTRRRLLAGVVATVLGAVGLRGAGAAACRPPGSVCRENANCCSAICKPKDRTGRRRCACSPPSLDCDGQCLCGCFPGETCATCSFARVCPPPTTCERSAGLSVCVAEQCTVALSGQFVVCGAECDDPARKPCICGRTTEGEAVCISDTDCATSTYVCPSFSDGNLCTASSQCSAGAVCVVGGTGYCTFNVCLTPC
jgi:hypothetical protein